MWTSNDHLTAICRREWAPSTTSFAPLRAAAKAPLFDRLGAGEQHRRHSRPSALAVFRLIAGSYLGRSSANARQQFAAHLLRAHSGPPLVAMGECANSLITNEPCYLRDRKVGVTQIMRGEIGAELTENFTEAQAFRSQPPRQRSAAHPKRLRDRAELRFPMR